MTALSARSKLFLPGRIGCLEVPNRIVFAATSSELADAEGFVGDDVAEYYAERARGGAGLIVVEATYVEQEGKRLHHNAMLHDDRFIAGMRAVVDAIHAGGARAALQLNHGGRESIPEVCGMRPLAPSPIASAFTGVGEAVVPKELTAAEIDRIVERFADAAERARKAGFDAIELHGAHGYLIGQFISPDSNRREDGYGGGPQNRARFCVRIIRAIKERLGRDYPVIVRMNGSDHVKDGLELEDAVIMAQLFEAAGADSISVSGGVHASRPYMVVPGMSVERGCYIDYGIAIRRHVSVPTMVVGRINTPALAEDILAHGQADFVCLSRALIADPYFPSKAKAGEVDKIAPCIACNECIATVHRHKGLACTVNPMVSRELELKPLLATEAAPRRVVIVGSGAAGLSAAITAARRGHKVHLYERDDRIGGQLRLAFQPPHREEIGNLLRYFQAEIDRLDISVRVGHDPTVEELRQLEPDAIVVATGAEPAHPVIPGANLPHVSAGWEILSGAKQISGACVVVGGGLVGVEVADMLASRGAHVTLLVRSAFLKKAVHADRVYYLDRIRELGVEVISDVRILAIGEDSIEIQPDGGLRRSLHGMDSVVLCTGYGSRKAESAHLEQLGVPMHYVGDVKGPRKFFEAIEEGTLTALKIT